MSQNNIPTHIKFMIICVLILAVAFVTKMTYGLAGTSVYDKCNTGSYSCGGIKVPTIVVYTPVPTPKPKKTVKPKAVVPKTQPTPKETKVEQVTIDKCTSKVRTDLVNHAYLISGGDMKFLGTISAESMWDVNSNGDGGKSFGLCQFHKGYQPDNYKAYKALKTDKEKLEFCYEKYKIWKDKGILHKRLYGSNVWQKGNQKVEITCK